MILSVLVLMKLGIMTNINNIIDLDTLGLKISMNAFKKYLRVNER